MINYRVLKLIDAFLFYKFYHTLGMDNEKQMIGSILDESDDESQVPTTSVRKGSAMAQFSSHVSVTLLSTKPNSIDQDQFVAELYECQPRLYSPQLKAKYQKNYPATLTLQKVPMVQSAPNTALKPRQKLRAEAQYNYDDIFPVSPPYSQADPTHYVFYQQHQNVYAPQSYPAMDENQFLDGDLIAKCKDQQSAREVQKMFQNADLERRAQMFQKLEKGTLILSKDVFGNYVIQILLEFGTPSQRLKILQNIMTYAITLSLHSYGCRVIQKALEIFQSDEKEFNQLFDNIKSKVRELVIDGNGNHVVQKIILLRNREVAQWVQDGVRGQVSRLVKSSFGCRIIQKMISISQLEAISSILEEVMDIAKGLCFSQFGNYIIQQLLTDSTPDIQKRIQNIIVDNFVELSLNKFGSNVVDKAVKMSQNEFKREIIDILLTQRKGTQCHFVTLSGDAFGNYVVQNFFKHVDSQLQEEIYNKIIVDQNLINELQQSQFGSQNSQIIGLYVYQSLLKRQELVHFRL